MQYELRNTVTGETKWVGAEEAQAMGIDVKQSGDLPLTEKIGNIPIIGKPLQTGMRFSQDIIHTLANKDFDQRSQMGMESTKGLLDLASKQTDPVKKERLLKAAKESENVNRELVNSVISGYSPDIEKSPLRRGFEYSTSVAELAALPDAVKTIIGVGKGGVNLVKKLSNPTEVKNIVTKVNNKLSVTKNIAGQATKSAKGQPFDWKAMGDKVVEEINSPSNAGVKTQLSKYHRQNFLGNFGKYGGVKNVTPPATAETALEIRRGLQAKWGNGFLGKLISSLQETSDPIKSQYNKIVYKAINDQLHKIPGVSKADASIWLINQLKDIGITGYVGKKGMDVINSITGKSSK